jgi:flagellar protein FlaJ
MKFRIPFTFGSIEKLKRRPKFFLSKIKYKKKSSLADSLESSNIDITREEYIAISLSYFLYSFIALFVISTIVLAIFKVGFFYLLGLGIALVFSFFVFFSQIVYPRIYVARRQRNIEKNLISALQDVLVQLNSGIPLFSVLVNISNAAYGELSIEFKKAVSRINAGEPESEVLDDLGKKNPSIFFQKTLWQISNGMRAGSNISIVIKDSIKSLTEEQLIQIQVYGNKLNPLIVFYMLVAVIIPALSITFLTILSSMVELQRTMTMLLFIGLFIFVVLVQIMFLGILKSRRPSLL